MGVKNKIQVNLDMTDSMGPGKLVRHMQNPSYTYDEYLILGLGRFKIESLINWSDRQEIRPESETSTINRAEISERFLALPYQGIGLGPSISSAIYAKIRRTVVCHIQVHL